MKWPTGVYWIDTVFWIATLALLGKAVNLIAKAVSRPSRRNS